MGTSILTVFGRHDCPLCDEALDLVKSLRKEYSFELEEVNITADPNLFEKYKESIPVIAVNGQVCLMALFDEGDLRRALARRGVLQK